MAVNIPGVIAIVVFYLLVLGTGIWATVKSKRKQKKCAASGMEMALLGNRSISLVVGVLTMTGERLVYCLTVCLFLCCCCCIHMD